jgi:hypothetical protein
MTAKKGSALQEIFIQAKRSVNDRNLTTHVYNEQMAQEIIERITHNYLNEFEQLLKAISR